MANAKSTRVTRKAVSAIVAATFPDYNGRKIRIEARTTVHLFGLNWCDGSRSQYRACTLAGQWVGGADRFNHVHPAFNHAEGAEVAIPPGHVLVQHSIFCGKDHGITIYANPADMPAVLPAPIGVAA